MVLLVLLPISMLGSTVARSFAHQAVAAVMGDQLTQANSSSKNISRKPFGPTAIIQGFRRFDGGSFARLVVELSNTPDFKATSGANNLNIQFVGANLGPNFQQALSEASGLVKEVTATEANGSVEMRLRFRAGTSFAAFTLGAPPRLVIDVRDDESTDSELEAELGRIYTPLTNNGVVKRIVIDAGHGGKILGQSVLTV